ncbi:activator of 90 kDa heat shock protein ATPase homolog 1-like isoform X3 [Thunnus albacares]|uniref:activator of 90 kDa heat shock protein ATPase homolog 1-like isoform X3 n=1 Tax=Thunnus albacares TaxID=8236 RepID=UPI001CF642FA|nr:activator of 90 kDa heat shock protein ATPase homolog 1-like isoform X3 [Thunnus albacares]
MTTPSFLTRRHRKQLKDFTLQLLLTADHRQSARDSQRETQRERESTPRTERDVSSWSSERLRQLLLAIRVEGSEGICQLTDVSKLDGEASINNRKGKLIFFYEWQLRAGWLGTSRSGVKFRGTIEVSNLSDENDTDDLDITASLCKDQPNTSLLDLMKKSGVQEVRRVLGEYVHQLKSEFSQGMILPTATATGPTPTPPQNKKNQIKTSKTQISPASRCSSSPAPDPAGVRIPTCSFSLRETFLTSADELYRTFINQESTSPPSACSWRSEETRRS